MISFLRRAAAKSQSCDQTGGGEAADQGGPARPGTRPGGADATDAGRAGGGAPQGIPRRVQLVREGGTRRVQLVREGRGGRTAGNSAASKSASGCAPRRASAPRSRPAGRRARAGAGQDLDTLRYVLGRDQVHQHLLSTTRCQGGGCAGARADCQLAEEALARGRVPRAQPRAGRPRLRARPARVGRGARSCGPGAETGASGVASGRESARVAQSVRRGTGDVAGGRGEP